MWTAGAIIAIALGVAVSLGWFTADSEAYSFGACLADRGVTLYGSDRCPNCQEQKALFDDDFSNVDYVNCDFQKELCRSKGVTFYPVWSRGNDALVGVQSLNELSRFSGCELSAS